MKTGLKRRILAVLLAASLTVSQSGTVFAAEEVSQDRVVLSEDQAAAGSETVQPSENETVAPETGDAGQTQTPEASQPSENTAETPAAEAAAETENTVSEDAAEGAAVFKGMPEGFTLSERQIEGKKNITEHDVLDVLDTLKAGEDYVEDEVIFSCDDPEYAKVVAEAYNGTLVSCKSGVAVIKLDTTKVTVKDAVKAGSDLSTTLPPVDVNTWTKLDDPVLSEGKKIQDAENLNGIMAAKRATLGGRDWSYWKERFEDPALNPAYTDKDPYDDNIVKNMYQWMHDALGDYAAWGASQGEGVTVAVIDSGVYAEHPDLAGQVIKVTPSDYVVNGTAIEDGSGHGTHVAGIIAASANKVGGVGVAPAAKILALPIFEKNGCTPANEAAAINYVTNGGNIRAQVINMSLGGPIYNQTVQDAIKNAHDAGVTVCISMGNEHANNISFPAGCDYVIAVSAMDESWQKSDFSTFGDWADIGAPGTAIFSTWNGHYDNRDRGGDCNLNTDYDYYSSWDGTSMASPVVAGVCALYISAKGGKADPDEVENAIKKTASKVSSPYKIGAGMVNAAGVLALAESTEAPAISIPGTISGDSVITFSDNNAAGKTQGFVYTINGKKPSIKGGEVKEGIYVENAITPGKVNVSIAELINNGIQADESVKLQVMRITGIGTASDIATETIQIPSASAAYTVAGPVLAARGKSVTYKLNPGFKKGKVVWSLEGAPSGVTINKKTGKVSIKKSASGEFTVIGEAEGKKGTLAVKIVDPAKSITLKSVSVNKDINIPKEDKNGNLKSARVYNADITATKDIIENVIALEGKADNEAPLSFTSSKPSVARVDATGRVTGRKAGTAKITCKATDGSNKKLVLTVKVVVPVSKLDMFPDRAQECVAYGKKMKIRPALGSAYGKPTVKKVQWEIVKVEGYTSGTNSTDVTSNAKSYFKINNGNLTVNKNLATAGSYGYYDVTVRVKATDGSGIYADKAFHVVSPTKTLTAKHKTPIKLKVGDAYQVALYSGDLGWDYTMTTGGRVIQPEVTSSNPAVANAYVGGYSKASDSGSGMDYVCILTTHKKGNATITLKATDGSGKKASIKFKVQ